MVDEYLTDRQRAVVRLRCNGQSISRVSAELGISERALLTHIRNLEVRLELNSLDELCEAAATGIKPNVALRRFHEVTMLPEPDTPPKRKHGIEINPHWHRYPISADVERDQ